MSIVLKKNLKDSERFNAPKRDKSLLRPYVVFFLVLGAEVMAAAYFFINFFIAPKNTHTSEEPVGFFLVAIVALIVVSSVIILKWLMDEIRRSKREKEK